jgi:hypothetical protein
MTESVASPYGLTVAGSCRVVHHLGVEETIDSGIPTWISGAEDQPFHFPIFCIFNGETHPRKSVDFPEIVIPASRLGSSEMTSEIDSTHGEVNAFWKSARVCT